MILTIADPLFVRLVACVAKAASALVSADRRAGLAHKVDGSIVTAADLACETALRNLIEPLLPAIPVIGEESASPDDRLPDAPAIVLIDPLDGTSAFADGRNDYSVNVAIVRDGMAVTGILALPAQQRIFAGTITGNERAAAVWHCDATGAIIGAAVPVRVAPDSDRHRIGLVSERHGDEHSEAALARAGVSSRLAASSASKFAAVAEGRGHLYPRYGTTMAWDTAAGQALLEAAGGCVIDPGTGAPLRYAAGRQLRNGPFIAAASMRLAKIAAGLQ